jgi:hypothetical protein
VSPRIHGGGFHLGGSLGATFWLGRRFGIFGEAGAVFQAASFEPHGGSELGLALELTTGISFAH